MHTVSLALTAPFELYLKALQILLLLQDFYEAHSAYSLPENDNRSLDHYILIANTKEMIWP